MDRLARRVMLMRERVDCESASERPSRNLRVGKRGGRISRVRMIESHSHCERVILIDPKEGGDKSGRRTTILRSARESLLQVRPFCLPKDRLLRLNEGLRGAKGWIEIIATSVGLRYRSHAGFPKRSPHFAR